MDFLFAKRSPEVMWGAFFILIVIMFLVGLYCGITAWRDLNNQDKEQKNPSKDDED
ncbi:MAG: hypothetical protein LBS60_12025 [Deltaproteobacteria bacterium]|jgi:hypothetical protein|nr:hypothetical protein [Deltaproteobacteria bacterium]